MTGRTRLRRLAAWFWYRATLRCPECREWAWFPHLWHCSRRGDGGGGW